VRCACRWRPGQTYAFDVRAAGDGQAHAELRAERPQRQAADRACTGHGHCRSGGFLRQIVESRYWMPRRPRRFLPDTLVGYLEVAHGNTIHRAYFAADPEQAYAVGGYARRISKPSMRVRTWCGYARSPLGEA